MDIEQLRSFVAVADSGSLAGAARRLDHPKSTVAKRIGQLERSLAMTLIERGRRGVSITDEGHGLLGPAREVIEKADEVEAAARAKAGVLAGRIRLSVPTLLGQTMLPAMLGRFAEANPAVSLEIIAEDRYIDVGAEGYDCAVRLGPGTDSSLLRRKLGESTLALVAHRDYAEALRCSHPSDIERLETIGFAARQSDEVWMLRCGTRAFKLRPRSRLSVTSLPAILNLLHSYRAVALLPTFLLQRRPNAGVLARVCPDWQGDSHDITVVFPAKAYMPPRLRAFVDHLVREFKGQSL